MNKSFIFLFGFLFFISLSFNFASIFYEKKAQKNMEYCIRPLLFSSAEGVLYLKGPSQGEYRTRNLKKSATAERGYHFSMSESEKDKNTDSRISSFLTYLQPEFSRSMSYFWVRKNLLLEYNLNGFHCEITASIPEDSDGNEIHYYLNGIAYRSIFNSWTLFNYREKEKDVFSRLGFRSHFPSYD